MEAFKDVFFWLLITWSDKRTSFSGSQRDFLCDIGCGTPLMLLVVDCESTKSGPRRSRKAAGVDSAGGTRSLCRSCNIDEAPVRELPVARCPTR